MNLDFTLLIVFLVLNLIVGLSFGHQARTLKDYALGGKRFSTAVLTATIVATWYGGGFLAGTLEEVYKSGLQHVIIRMGGPICILFTGQVFAIRMGEFLNNLSVAEAMGNLYGKVVQIITAICGLLLTVCIAAIQFKVISQILALVGFEEKISTPLAAIIVITYSALGGIRAVTFTDVFQFFVFSIFIPVLVWTIWKEVKNPQQVFYILTSHSEFSLQIGWHSKFINTLALAFLFMTPRIDPPTFQRISMGSNVLQVKRAFTYASVIGILAVIVVSFVSILLLASDGNLPHDKLLKYIVGKYSYPGFTGFFCAGIMALAMSTADSYLNSAAVLFTNDILKPLQWVFKREIIIARLASLGLGIFALFLALYSQDFWTLCLITEIFYVPITVPLLLAILGFRSTTRSVLIGMAASLITILFWDYFGFKEINNCIPSMLANLIFLLGSHYLLSKPPKTGWVGIKDSTYLQDKRQKRRWARKKFRQKVKNFNLNNYLQQLLPKIAGRYIYFSFYVILTTYCALYTLPKYPSLHKYIESLVLYPSLFVFASLSIYLLFFDYCKSKRLIIYLWPLVTTYCLVVVSTLLLILSGFKKLQALILLANVVVMICLFSLPFALVLMVGGLLTAKGIFHYYIDGVVTQKVLATLKFNFSFTFYLFLAMGIIVAVLLWYRHMLKHLEAQKEYISSTHKASEQDRLHTLQYQNYLKTSIEGLTEPLALTKKALTSFAEKVPAEKETVQKAIDQIEGFVAHYKNSFYHTMDFLKLQVREISLENLLDKLYRILQKEGRQEQVSFQVQTQQKNLACDPAKITQLLATSIRTLQKQTTQEATIHLQVQDTQLAYQFKAVPNQTRNLAALAFTLTTEDKVTAPKVYYQGNTKEPTITIPANLSQLPQRDNARIIDAHYGYSQSKDSLILHVIPVKLRDIRPKVVDETPVATQEAPLDNAASIKQEKDLLTALKSKTKMDIGLAKEVIRQIKQWHQGQLRKSGDLFYTHPMTVALLLLELTQDPEAIVAALFHDAVEDTLVTLEEVQYKYGKTVAFIVDKVTHLNSTLKKAKLTERENQLQLAANQDPRVIMIKLADRLHNVRTIHFHPNKARQKEIAQESLDFYVPLGRMLGLPAVDKVVDEIQERCQTILAN